ncbi:MAG: endonuclease MutS2 [Bacteroides sp.]|nr:endonuclease MutS2 [Bacteroides sp.]MCM1548909.1 endonuclease MutS2 [Clostridium sp.]
MNKRSLRILEYNKIIDMLIPCAGSPMGQTLCKRLKPSTDQTEIRKRQEETRDALSRLYKQGSISFSGVTDIGMSLKRLEVGATLSPAELLDIARLLDNTLSVRQYGISEEEAQEPDCLDSRFLDLMPLEHLSRDIRRCILSADEIADDASSALKALRRSKKQINDKIHTQLLNIVNSQDNRSLLQDNLVTMRNGRYCIPVKQEYRSSVPGMIHDQSSSGSTLFVEPMAVVNLNNELKELENKELLEIERILAGLSEQAALERNTLQCNVALLTELDFIFARAKLAKSYQGTEPVFNTRGFIHIKQGRHPLLDKNTVVPIDITLGDAYTMLIITGPNTGGKTVSLKTVGLFTLMGQAGLHIPAFEGSELCVFRDVFADIGDEQSIEQSLSTFSSHMSNIVYIVQHSAPDTLVLFDELGGGTDPVEGAALAIAILNHLRTQGIRCMATTHYSELKTFALSTEGIENASCEFDLASLRPTYRLMIGIPGKSNAFAISRKLGLPDYIIEAARSQIDTSSLDFESLISDLERSKKTIEEEEQKAAAYREEIAALRNQLKEKQESLEQQRAKLLKNAREEAMEIIEEAKELADSAIRKYQKWERNPAKADNKAMEAERSKLRDKMKAINGDISKPRKQRRSHHKAEDFQIGDTVYIISMDATGTVQSLPNAKGEISVQAGILHITLPITDCEITDAPVEETPKPVRRKSQLNLERASSIRPEINVIGLTVDDAITKIDKYLDDALLSNLSQVTIIHGKGTGALRKGIHDYLKRQKHVAAFRNGEFGEGDMGVTILELQ